jgi:hypothetical protein
MTHRADPIARSAASTQPSPISTILCWIVILGIVGFALAGNTLAHRAVERAAAASHSQRSPVTLEVTSRIVVGQSERLSRPADGKQDAAAIRLRKQLLAQVDGMAKTPNEKLDAAAVAGELEGSAAAVERLDALRPSLKHDPDLQADAQTLRLIYATGPNAVSTAAREALIRRHGWFGHLALAFGQSSSDPQRAAAMDSAARTAAASAAIGLSVLGLFVVGFFLLVVGIILFALGHLRFAYRPGLPIGPPVFLETFALWLVIFTGLSLAAAYWKLGGGLGAREAVLLVVSFVIALWPLARGISWRQLRLDLGWHAGRGAGREMLCGLLGYIAGLPIIAVGMLISLVLIARAHQQPTHPIVFQIGHASALNIVGLYFAACVGAPLLEETMFRGALYHHLRRRWRLWWSAAVVSFLFAAIHPQGWTAIPLLGSIAIVLALLREWRGTLLASFTAHAANNAAGLTILLYLLR